MPRIDGSRITLRIALNGALAAAALLIDRQPQCAHEWREVYGWTEAATNDLNVSRVAESVPAEQAGSVSDLVAFLDGQLALAASLVDSLAIGEAQRASEHAQRRAVVVPEGGPVRSGHAAQ